jgi:hypothetical protein
MILLFQTVACKLWKFETPFGLKRKTTEGSSSGERDRLFRRTFPQKSGHVSNRNILPSCRKDRLVVEMKGPTRIGDKSLEGERERFSVLENVTVHVHV